MTRLARTHSIDRTSPKGEPFVGTCFQCGKTGLKMEDALKPCENIAGLTEEEALIMALQGPKADKQ